MPAPKAPKAPTMKAVKAAKKGGRPKSTLSADARRELVAAKRDEAEKVVAEMAKKAETLQATSPADKGTLGDQAATNIKIIREIAAHSGNLKGTFQKGLKDAAASLEKVMSALSSGSTGEETERLREICERMENKISSLEKEMAELRATVERERRTEFRQEKTEVLQRLILTTMGPVLDARFEGLQDRLLPEKRMRPALAADKRRTPANQTTDERLAASVADMISESDADVEEVPVPAPASRTTVWRKAPPLPTPEPKPRKGIGKRGRKGKGKKGNSAPTAPEPVPLATPPLSSPRSANSPSYAAVTAAPASRPPAPPPAPGPSEVPWKKVPEKGLSGCGPFSFLAAAWLPRGGAAAAAAFLLEPFSGTFFQGTSDGPGAGGGAGGRDAGAAVTAA
ncbi:mitogen-activated protein kinase 7-like [Amyelois transitella]|uniref:mitogen-activated protein kinase 7-like n=1 Tax=Amyelois transitella TaxID=680683 RepID=UPI00298F4D38|nr:mitogen-activated protein kinase 7-like [Amyelois transitella]